MQYTADRPVEKPLPTQDDIKSEEQRIGFEPRTVEDSTAVSRAASLIFFKISVATGIYSFNSLRLQLDMRKSHCGFGP